MNIKQIRIRGLINAFAIAVCLAASTNSNAGPLFEEMTINDKTMVLQAISRFCMEIQFALEADCLKEFKLDPLDSDGDFLDCLREAERKGEDCQEMFERLLD